MRTINEHTDRYLRLIAVRNADDKNHKNADQNNDRCLKGKYGKVFVSDYVFDEAVTLAYIRTGSKKFACDIGYLPGQDR